MMNEKPLISVIVPIYNVANYIRSCVSSILHQTYDNLEIILVNDGSTDDSMEQISDLISDSRIIVFHQENQGLSATRNVGIEKASGEYLTFVDSDDSLTTDAIEKLYQAIIKYDVSLSIGSVVRKKDQEIYAKIIFDDEVLDLENLLYPTDSVPKNTIKITAWGKLYHRDLFENIRYPKGCIHEDEYTTYKLYLAAKKAATISDIIYEKDFREGSIMNTSVSIKNADCLYAFKEKVQIFEKEGLKAIYPYSSYRFYAERLLTLGQKQGDKALCRIVRKNYWFGFNKISNPRKIRTLSIFMRYLIRSFIKSI